MSYGANQTMCCEVEPEEKWTGRPRRAKAKRPKALDKVVPIYEHDGSRLPDAVRVSFEDGSTAVYDIHVDQPHPACVECITVIREWNNGYNNQPMRRRRKP